MTTSTETLKHAEAELEAKQTEVESLAAEVVAETIEEAIVTATEAVIDAAESHARIDDVTEELQHHEDADQWMRTKLNELALTISTLSSAMESLSSRLASLETLPEPAIVETPTVSDTTKTEVLPSAVDESREVEPAPIEPEPKRKRVRMV